MSKVGETIFVLAVVIVTVTFVYSKVDCGKIPFFGTYCVAH